MTQSLTPKNLDTIAQQPQQPQKAASSIQAVMNGILDGEGFRRRFDDLMGARAPQFISSVVSLCNADSALKQAVFESPMTIVQAALKAATFDLPIDPGLGYAYIVPFKNKGKHEAAFILGYKGMNQLALRTGVYKRLNVCDVREGELKRYDRLTEDIEIVWVEDETARDALPIVGWVGYFRLVNGTEKTIYMSREAIQRHERKNRKGAEMTRGWRENFDEMAAKTVFRRLVGKYGIMSIDYQHRADPAALKAADDLARGFADDDAGIDAGLEADAVIE